MNAIVIEHVALNELPKAWRAHLPSTLTKHVTIRIEEEVESAKPANNSAVVNNPLFGMWQDRQELAEVSAYTRQLRAPRF
jgi:hypothetical protein